MSMGKSSDGGAGKMAKSEAKNAAAAQKKITEYGDKAVSFTDTFFNQYIKPQLAIVEAERNKGIQRADQVFGQQQAQFQDREQQYQQLGKPAVQKFFDMANNYDEEAEAQRRGIPMMGDVAAAQANAQAQTSRALNARGVNPTSGEAIKAQGRNDMQAALVKSKEMQRLRELTNKTKMDLTTQAAGFGADLGKGTLGLPGQSLQSGVIGSDIATQSTGTLTAGAGIPMAGLELASKGQEAIFSGSKSAQASAQSAATQAASQDGGLGGIIGTVAGGLISKMPMLPFSDRRLKKDITVVGVKPDGLKVYEFNYIWGGPRQRGYMADEVHKLYPDAVHLVGEYLAVDYSKVEYQPW